MTMTGADDEVRPAIREMLRAGELPPPPLTGIELRLRSKRGPSSRLDVKVLVAAAAVAILVVLAFTAGPLRTDHRAASPGRSTTIPLGWATYSAYGVQISVPRSWSVQYFGQCPDGQKPGTLFIGTSQFIDQCQYVSAKTGRVALSVSSDMGTGATNPAPIAIVNGLTVIEVGAPSQRTWVVASHNATVTGSGPSSLAVLKTLAPATREATPAEGIASGTVQLIALGTTPVTGRVEVTDLHTGKRRTVLAIDGAFSFEAAPGPYRLTINDGSAPCGPVTVTVQAGQRVTAPPIDCQGE
jgi:hypothetical protein